MGLESYLAVCLREPDGRHLGHLAVLDAARMEVADEDVATLRIFAARAAAELERRAQAAALAASRARVVEAADAERRRLGRDLHDGAQQRLLAVSNLLRVGARRQPAGRPAADACSTARPRSSTGPRRLRELARGLIPWRSRSAGCPTRSAPWPRARRARRRSPSGPRRSPRPSPRPSTSWSRSALPTPSRHARGGTRAACASGAATGSSRSRSATTARAAPSRAGTGLRGPCRPRRRAGRPVPGREPRGRRHARQRRDPPRPPGGGRDAAPAPHGPPGPAPAPAARTSPPSSRTARTPRWRGTRAGRPATRRPTRRAPAAQAGVELGRRASGCRSRAVRARTAPLVGDCAVHVPATRPPPRRSA